MLRCRVFHTLFCCQSAITAPGDGDAGRHLCTNTIVREGKCECVRPHHRISQWGLMWLSFQPVTVTGLFLKWRTEKALRSIVSRRRTNTPGEYMGNDVSLANRRRFELAFESDCIRMKINTSTHARFKDIEEVKRSQSLCLCETVQAVRSTTEGPTVPDAFVAEGTQLGDFLCLNLQRLKS